MHQCGNGQTPDDIKLVFDRTCAGKRSPTQWYYYGFENGMNALKELGWTLEGQLENEESYEYYYDNARANKNIEKLCCYLIPRKDHFTHWQYTKTFDVLMKNLRNGVKNKRRKEDWKLLKNCLTNIRPDILKLISSGLKPRPSFGCPEISQIYP
jgi:hypothetical protein